jgi:hypothetical protein
MKPVIFLDFDRTLFDTDLFWIDFAECLAVVIGISPAQILNAYTDYVTTTNLTSYIFYEDYIKQHNINHKLVQESVDKMLKNKQYLFEDAIELLDGSNNLQRECEVAVLTYGQELFQNLKISLCKELKNLTSYITLLPKTEFIDYYMPNRFGLLVDDKLGQNLPNGWVEVHIDRNSHNSKARLFNKDIYEIYDLGQLAEVLPAIHDHKRPNNS